jgi:hypothetical protein
LLNQLYTMLMKSFFESNFLLRYHKRKVPNTG